MFEALLSTTMADAAAREATIKVDGAAICIFKMN